MKYLIVNADDFGASSRINHGILMAHRRGIVTSASLMVDMPATAEAVLLTREFPGLSIGLHVCFSNGGENAPVDLNDAEACNVELHRQFHRFVERMGRLPTHLDSHHHIHRSPILLPLFLDLASKHGLFVREHSPVRYFSKFYGQWEDGTHLEWIRPKNLLHLLETELQEGFTELGCHPGYTDPRSQSSYNIEREVELTTLCDPAVRARLAEWGICLIDFREAGRLLSPVSR